MLLLVALLAGPGGQGVELLEARLEASSRTAIAAEVRLHARIRIPAAARGSSSKVPFHLLEVRDARVEGLEVREGEVELEIRLDRSRQPFVRGEIDLPPSGRADRVLSFRYRVERAHAGEPSVAIPVIIVGDGASAARAGAFSARLALPEAGEGVVSESFPSNAVVTDGGKSYQWRLPLEPAFVSVGAPPVESGSFLDAIRRAGFSFWGLWAVCALVVSSYLAWMKIDAGARRGES
jgi:hypothetical protein